VKSRFLSGALAAGAPPVPRPDWLEELDQLGTRIDAAEAKDRWKLVLKRAAQVERIRLERGPLPAPPLPAPGSDHTPLLELLAARGQAALQLFLAGGRVVAVLLQAGSARDILELPAGRLAMPMPPTRARRPRYATTSIWQLGLVLPAIPPQRHPARRERCS
jgi:hypothetical protein